MLTFLEMKKAFKAGGERANKITLSPPQPAVRTDVQTREEAVLLRLPAWEGSADSKSWIIGTIKSQLRDRKGDLAPESETENNP